MEEKRPREDEGGEDAQDTKKAKLDEAEAAPPLEGEGEIVDEAAEDVTAAAAAAAAIGDVEEKQEKGEEKKAEEVKLGPMVFTSGKDMFMYFYELLHGWVVDYNFNEYEQMVLADLLNKGHSDPESKAGPGGAKGFQVRVHPVWRSRCYYSIRADGTAVDFSYRKCVDKLMTLPPEFLKTSGGAADLDAFGARGGGGGGRGRRGGGGRGFRGRGGRGRGRSRH